MMILLVSFVTSSLKTGWKSEVDYLLIHGCKGRFLFRIFRKRFDFHLVLKKATPFRMFDFGFFKHFGRFPSGRAVRS